MNFLFACGGTAGHINPALAIADALRKLMPDCGVKFVGTGRELENRLIPAQGYEIENIQMTGFARGIRPDQIKYNMITVKNMAVASRQAAKIIDTFNPDAVIGTGGYVCYPVLSQAVKRKIPTLVHESNAVPGLTTKMLSGKVDKVLTAFPGLEQQYKKPERVFMTGTPVRSELESVRYEQARARLGIAPEEKLVVSFWGSLGAARMNEVMREFIAKNIDTMHFKHIHATGGGVKGLEKFRASLAEDGIQKLPAWEDVRAYIDDMPVVMSAADLILCRAGASTMSELTTKGRPAVIVPSPNVTGDHQRHNAEQLANAGGAVMIQEQDCTAGKLWDTVIELLSDPKRLAEMSDNLRTIGTTGAADSIAAMILQMC